MNFREAAGADKAQRLPEFFVRFAGESDDQVGRDGAAGEIRVQEADALVVARGVVLAVHAAQDAVAAALEAQVELRAEIWEARQRAAECFVDRPRFERAETDAHIRHGGADRREQVAQDGPVFPFLPPGGNFDAVNDDLTIALGGELLRLGDGSVQRHGAHAAARVGDDAIGTEIVAPVLHLQQRARPRGEAAGGQDLKVLSETVVFNLLPLLLVFRRLLEVRNKCTPVCRADEDVDVQLADLIRVRLRVAAADADDGVRIQAADAADGVARFLVGDRSHRTSIDDIAVTDLVKFAERMPVCKQHLLHCLCFILIDLAAEGVECEFHR